ncbi:S-adenosyl-L-methionine-dependent methyltransferase [Macrolepiota fuliginosa MF-IS2]|uniref:S-adenosyl-L-methionine-dependent methyltransferase n=1 Tax=Macrolepiota fuliginosa MF-IS2 TaxID=1400762 RepID=A0A9P5XDP9_9AGAR|nr:S-adenosyl-L-methionine-dependent methyltransferase [Macrolepiota fuliginosa MF-IS2]
MNGSISNISSLVAIIASAAGDIESYYKTSTSKPGVPSLDDTDPHPLDNAIYPPTVRHAVQVLEGACAQLCATVASPGSTLLNRFLSAYQPTCISVALRGCIADVLLAEPTGMPVSEISKRCGVEEQKLGRVLRLLCSHHIFREVRKDVFANNRLSMQLLSSNPISSIGLHLADEPGNKAASFLTETLLDPEWGPSYAPELSAFNRSTGYTHPLWLYFEGKDSKKGAEQGARFARGMIGWNNSISAEAIVTDFPWAKLPKGAIVNDVGGGWGNIAMQLYRRYPNLNMKLQDLPERIRQARNEAWPKECPEAIADSRIEFRSIDLLQESPIQNCDIYLLKNVIHSWSNDAAVKALENIRKAMSPASRLLVYEYIIQNTNRVPVNESEFQQAPLPLLPNFGAGRIRQYYLDLAVMALTNSGERRLDDYIRLATAAGLKLVDVWDLGEMGVMEFAVEALMGT